MGCGWREGEGGLCADVMPGKRGQRPQSLKVWSMSPEWAEEMVPHNPSLLLTSPISLYLKHPLSVPWPSFSCLSTAPQRHRSFSVQSVGTAVLPVFIHACLCLLCPSSLLGGDNENQIVVRVMFSRSSQAK